MMDDGLTENLTKATLGVGPSGFDGFWLETKQHQSWLMADAVRQLDFFRPSLNSEGGFYQLDGDGNPRKGVAQELFATTRLIHSFALGKQFGISDCDPIIDHGMRSLCDNHHDSVHGGYIWSFDGTEIVDDRKLAYGHVFVLLAAASAKQAGHPGADDLLADITGVLDDRFWDDKFGLFEDEANRDWTPFSSYRGFNANMHATEALLTAFEATGDPVYLSKAGRILEFFVFSIAAQNNNRIPEHYSEDWTVDRAYSGDPMFRPAGTTPGHSFELGRLLLQHWDLTDRSDARVPKAARGLIEQALLDAWDRQNGGFVYTLDFDGNPDNRARYWWPVTEAIGAVAALIKLERNSADEEWYRRLWQFADQSFVDHDNGGWYPEINDKGQFSDKQFKGKPDIYHSIQASLFPLCGEISRLSLA